MREKGREAALGRERPEEAGGSGPGGPRSPSTPAGEPCLRCGVSLPVRQMGCKGGHCPNCGHPYPHGDCSD